MPYHNIFSKVIHIYHTQKTEGYVAEQIEFIYMKGLKK